MTIIFTLLLKVIITNTTKMFTKEIIITFKETDASGKEVVLRDCSLESDPANMHCKTDSLEGGGVRSASWSYSTITIQTIHVCDCEGDLCNKDFASAGENGDDQSVMVWILHLFTSLFRIIL